MRVIAGPCRCQGCGAMVWLASTEGRTTRCWRDRNGLPHACKGEAS